MREQIKIQAKSVLISSPLPSDLSRQIKSKVTPLIGTKYITKLHNNLFQIGAKKMGVKILFKRDNTRNRVLLKLDLDRSWSNEYARTINLLPRILGQDYLRRLFTKQEALSLKYLITIPIGTSDKTLILKHAQNLYPLIEGKSKSVLIDEIPLKATFKLASPYGTEDNKDTSKITVTLQHPRRDKTFSIERAYIAWNYASVYKTPSIGSTLPEELLAQSFSDGIALVLSKHPEFREPLKSVLKKRKKLDWPTPHRYQWERELRLIRQLRR
ncbi:hypothetical protein, partial [Oleiphilus sp. HI0061]